MRIEKLSSSYLYFLSGLFASTAVNLLTTVATSTTPLRSLRLLLGTTGLWFLASVAAAGAAEQSANGRSKLDRLGSSRLSPEEQVELETAVLDGIKVRFTLWFFGCLLLVGAGVGGLVWTTLSSRHPLQ